MIHFTCDSCANTLFFENSRCLRCGASVGYDPASDRMVKLGAVGQFSQCVNGIRHGVCNWVQAADSAEGFCRSCALNRTIPDLTVPGNAAAWGRLEAAKRRVLRTLSCIGLRPLPISRSENGLAFDMLSPVNGNAVFTGHSEGIITINVLEADDVYSERMRTGLGEPYRTLVGHFRHEMGHYYWDQFLRWRSSNDPLFGEWRARFGDERRNYDHALLQYYRSGASPNWSTSFISAYASSHPWEDWAETWAQYLNIVDAMETAHSFGITRQRMSMPFTPFSAADLNLPETTPVLTFLACVNGWMQIAPVLNEFSLSLGQGTLFPFVFTQHTVRKIHFIHEVVRDAIARGQALLPFHGAAYRASKNPDTAEAAEGPSIAIALLTAHLRGQQ